MSAFRTAVSEVEDGRVLIRGYSHEDLIGHVPYASCAFLTLVGRLPSASEARLVDAMLTSLLDHGFVAATVSAARYAASGNPQFVPSVAAGLLAAGQNTLSPEHSYELIESARRLRRDRGWDDHRTAQAIVAQVSSEGGRLPGLGHPVHKGRDFRASALFELAEQLGLAGDATSLYRAIHEEFVSQTGKRSIAINVDGCFACLGMDLGLTAKQTVAIALLAVLPGLMAHVIEEIDDGVPLRFITDGEYVGTNYRPLPPEYDNRA